MKLLGQVEIVWANIRMGHVPNTKRQLFRPKETWFEVLWRHGYTADCVLLLIQNPGFADVVRKGGLL
jgi:hypothetical protein